MAIEDERNEEEYEVAHDYLDAGGVVRRAGFQLGASQEGTRTRSGSRESPATCSAPGPQARKGSEAGKSAQTGTSS